MSTQPFSSPSPQQQVYGGVVCAYPPNTTEHAGGVPVHVVYVPQPLPSEQYLNHQQQQPYQYQQGQTANIYASPQQQVYGGVVYAYPPNTTEHAGGAPVHVVYVPQPLPSEQYLNHQQQQPYQYQQGQTANIYASPQQPPPPGYALSPCPKTLSFSRTFDAIRSPHTHLDVSSVNYLRCNEFRGYMYCLLLAAIIAALFTAQLTHTQQYYYGSSATNAITYFYTTTIQYQYGEEYRRTQTSTMDYCTSAKIRLILGATFACIGLVCCVASMLFAFADSPRRCIARCDIFQKNILKLNYHAPIVIAVLWASLLISVSLMADLNWQMVCGYNNYNVPLGYDVGPGMGLTIAAWCLVTVVESVRLYLVMSGWVPCVREGVVTASEELMV